MSTWIRVSKKNPCPVCGKPDWCTTSEGVTYCMRAESPHPHKSGGWLHFAGGEHRRMVTAPLPPKLPPQDFTALHALWTKTTRINAIQSFATSLGVEIRSLLEIDAVWANAAQSWAFPMRDGKNQIIGIRLRNSDGKKWAVPGSRQGIFIPQVVPQDTVYVPEGPTDTAALLSMGFYAVGRPNNICGGAMIAEWIKSSGIKRAVLVADQDDAGCLGAARVAGKLGCKTAIYCPPAVKDIREFYWAGGTRRDVENAVANLKWK